MRRIAFAAALLLGAMPAFAQSSGDAAADIAARTLEQNRRVVLSAPPARPAAPAQARASAPAPAQARAPASVPRNLRLAVEGRVAAR
ncbi:hypothetical protein [Siccirubricoccus phaeus]|uniref:hypothetical protein n=1 Tax=Siccirubricoccus phaeus TaxID=2595053 RepID=UPI00165A25E3|nr:hypothetical protein [Siccirubricoccus phaeus]